MITSIHWTACLQRCFSFFSLCRVYTLYMCLYPLSPSTVSCIGDKIVITTTCIHLYRHTSCSSGILVSAATCIWCERGFTVLFYFLVSHGRLSWLYPPVFERTWNTSIFDWLIDWLIDRLIVACAPGCDTCIMSGANKCDGPRCDAGYYITSNFLCSSKFSSTLQLLSWVSRVGR